MKQRALLWQAVDSAHTPCGPAEVELFLKGGRSAEGVGLDLHGVVVEVCDLCVVRQRYCVVVAGVLVAIQAIGNGDHHVGRLRT